MAFQVQLSNGFEATCHTEVNMWNWMAFRHRKQESQPVSHKVLS